jgi:FAD/FMN-containing dehydrogenase
MDSKMDSLKRLLGPNIDLINARFPKVSKNSCGYRLDACLKDGFEPNRVIAASEGTLALVTSAKMRIIDLPQYRLLMVLGFDDILAAVRFVPAILESSSPVALEMLDASVLRVAGKKESGCLLYVEFAGDDPAKVDTQMQNCRDKLTRMAAATSSTSVKVLEYATDDASMAKIWAARKAALGTTMNLTVGSRRPIGLIEDTVVYPKSLEEHITNLIAAYQDNKLDYVFYGHVGDGNIHTRPLVDVSSKSQFEMISALASRVFGDVIARGGTITGEHGDGLARVQYIELMYGKKITALFQVVKELFDPSYVLNPGKKVPFKSKGPT